MHLRDIPDMDAIMAYMENEHVKEAVIIGGGFIGIEVAENLIEMGIKTHLVEMLDQVMAPFDLEMASIIHAKLTQKGVHLHLSDGIKKVTGDREGKVILHSGTELKAGIIICAMGVRPENSLAKEAGLQIGVSGGIVVDEYMRTSDQHIFAVGDAVEVISFVEGKKMLIPLAGPANKQGRIAADNMCGLNSRYHKTLGTAIVKIFDLQAAVAGLCRERHQPSSGRVTAALSSKISRPVLASSRVDPRKAAAPSSSDVLTFSISCWALRDLPCICTLSGPMTRRSR